MVELSLHNVRGESFWHQQTNISTPVARLQLPTELLPRGFYLLVARSGSRVVVEGFWR